MKNPFEVGDTVTRDTGAFREMEIIECEENYVICQWMGDDGEPEEAQFNPWELKIVRYHDGN